MLNYIRAELYRNFNRMYLWVFTGILVALTLSIVFIARVNNIPDTGLTSLVQITTYMLTFPVYLLTAILDISVAEEQKNQTLRNVVTFGVSRSKIVISKLVVSVVLAFISAGIILTVFYGSAAVLLGLGSDFPGNIVSDLIKILAAIPLWIGAIAVGVFLATTINNNTIFAFIYGGLFLMTTNIIKLLTFLVSDKFKYIQNILITTQLKKLSAPVVASQDIFNAVIIGVSYTVVFTVLSMLYFRKKEIK